MPQNSVQFARSGTLGSSLQGGADLYEAAELIADMARKLAGQWSESIPPEIEVSVKGRTATLSCSAGPAYPAETQARHPLFGDREHWYGPPGRPFLGPALDQGSDAAMARYAKKIDAMCRRARFN